MKAIRKAYKFRLYPTKAQITLLDGTLRLCRELYNGALQERRDAYKRAGKTLNYYDQANQLPEIKEVRPDLNSVHSQVLQDVLKRVQKAFDNFFRRVKAGQTPGYPRFQGRDRYDSFTFPQGGWTIKNGELTLSKIGILKIKFHREAIGKVKTCTIKRDGDKWFGCFAVEYEFEPPIHQGGAIGIDVGLEHLLNLSNGEQVDNPHFFRKSEKRLAKAQRRLAKIPKNSPLRRKYRKRVTYAFCKVRNQRLDFSHKLSHTISSTYSLIAVEDLNIKGLAAGMLAKSVNDAGWSLFLSQLEYKVEKTGSKFIRVDPRQTSQICPECGTIAKKELSVRWHECPCGCSMHRDTAAAIVILSRGLATLRNQSVEAPPL